MYDIYISGIKRNLKDTRDWWLSWYSFHAALWVRILHKQVKADIVQRCGKISSEIISFYEALFSSVRLTGSYKYGRSHPTAQRECCIRSGPRFFDVVLFLPPPTQAITTTHYPISFSDFLLYNLTVEEGMEPKKTTANNLGLIQIYSDTSYSGNEPTADVIC
jgi:hypothetical protein